MARTQKNFSVLGDSISTFQGYSPWGAAHYSPDLGAATGVHTVEDTWWMQVIRALQGRLLSNLSISGNTISTAGTMGGFPPRRIAQLKNIWKSHPSMASRQTTSFSMPGSTTPIFMCRQKGSSGNTSSCSPVFGKPIPTHRSAAAH